MKGTNKWLCERVTVTQVNGQYDFDLRKGMKSKDIELMFGDGLMEEEELARQVGNKVTVLGKFKYQVYSPNSGNKWVAVHELIHE